MIFAIANNNFGRGVDFHVANDMSGYRGSIMSTKNHMQMSGTGQSSDQGTNLKKFIEMLDLEISENAEKFSIGKFDCSPFRLRNPVWQISMWRSWPIRHRLVRKVPIIRDSMRNRANFASNRRLFLASTGKLSNLTFCCCFRVTRCYLTENPVLTHKITKLSADNEPVTWKVIGNQITITGKKVIEINPNLNLFRRQKVIEFI